MSGRITRDGLDRVGPFHPYLVWAALLLFDIVLIAALLVVVTAAGDWIEDALFPGGTEWVPL